MNSETGGMFKEVVFGVPVPVLYLFRRTAESSRMTVGVPAQIRGAQVTNRSH